MSDHASSSDASSRKPATTPLNASTTSMPVSSRRALISVLPQEVVDQIAAGEVVQRPASVVKELLENCLDAGSTHIVIKVEKGGLAKLTITDNGSGIPKSGLALAATRHATSKLRTVEDFHALETFGFRGEALASISMVSRLTITTRTLEAPVAYSQTYRNGLPTAPNPKPSARKPGTTLMVQELFYNVPHRLKAYSKRESDEYNRILTVVQHYAIHYPHCGFCLERKHSNGTTLVDVNTSQLVPVKALGNIRSTGSSGSKEQRIAATKAVISHVLEPQLEPHISQLECSSTPKQNSVADGTEERTSNTKEFCYEAEVYFTSPTYVAKKSQFVLFLNDRLVDLPALKRTLEDIYADFGGIKSTARAVAKPILVVNVRVPGSQVDVNVHPSKRQVALMYQEELCRALASKVKEALHEQGQSFQIDSVAPKAKSSAVTSTKGSKTPVKNPYLLTSANKKRKHPEFSKEDEDDQTEGAESEDVTPKKKATSARKKTPPSQLIRTSKAAPVGAIEPFLVPTQPAPSTQSQSQSQMSATESSNPWANEDEMDDSPPLHKPECALSREKVDLSQPGAFALRCTCAPAPAASVLVKRPVTRPKRVIPTKCTYSSVHSLRKRINKRTDPELAKQLREAYFVGVVSPYRSLVQCGEELEMIHHGELAKELFYQLALARFGGPTCAQLGNGGADGVDIQTIIAQAIQLEDELVVIPGMQGGMQVQKDRLDALGEQLVPLEVNDTNQKLAEQATACLQEHADMLEEYFAIRIEQQSENEGDHGGGRVILTGLPVLLEGHSPEPHGLAIFLLRLATQVDWAEERGCFHVICRELGNYYALLPTHGKEVDAYVQHTLFPAISYLLLPSEHHKSDGNFTAVTKLSTLYKVFERC